ncbi:hypothetical protein [Flexivirga sp. B27]
MHSRIESRSASRMEPRSRPVALWIAAAAVAPYITLKLLWLGGSTIGLRTTAATDELHSTRMVIGNGVTIGLEALAILLVVGLTRPWGRRAPAWIVLGLAGGATGLLAPILLGLPAGGILQVALDGNLHTSGMDEMAWWVFALVYGGFGLLAVVIAVLAWRYFLIRWGEVLQRAPRRPQAWVVAVGAVGMLPFAGAMLGWGVFGPGTDGPPQMQEVAQRLAVAVTGVLVAIGYAAPLLRRFATRRPRATWLAVWTGCTTAALQGPTEVLLANHGQPSVAMVVLGCVAPPAAAAFGWSVLRGSTASRPISAPGVRACRYGRMHARVHVAPGE